MLSNSTKGLLLATLTASLWGVLSIILKISLKFYDSYTIVWFRFFIATLILILYHWIKTPEYLKIIKHPPKKLILCSLLLGMNYIGYMQGVYYAGPGVTQVIIQLGAITLAVLGFTFFKEKLTPVRVLGFTIAFTGMGVFYHQQLISSMEVAKELNTGVLWVLFGAWTWTGYAVLNKQMVQKYPAQQLNMVIYGLPALLFLPMVNFSSFTAEQPWWAYALMIILGINTLLAYGALSESFKYIEANKISIIINLNPIITFILLELMLTFHVEWIPIRAFSSTAYLGAFLVIFGAVLAIGFTLKKKKA